jgi:hypothetical protein
VRGREIARLAVVGLAVVVAGVASQSSTAGGFNPDPVFPAGPISASVSHQIPKLERVASALAGRRAVVNCWSNRDWPRMQAWQGNHHNIRGVDANGITYLATHRIELSPFVCQVLSQVIARSAQQPLFTAWAVTVLAHESAHASGIRAEHLAECRAITTEPRAAELLGISKPMAERLQHIYRGTVYPYESPLYRTPPCTAGQPGVVVPDTLGTAANLRPLARTARDVNRIFPRWRDIGGGNSIGPLDPCSPIPNRTWELTRYGETLQGPHEYLGFSDGALKSKRDLATALVRVNAMSRCDLRLNRIKLRNSHSTGTVSAGSMPTAVRQLSPQVKAEREVYRFHGKTWNNDNILIFDRHKNTLASLYFAAPAGHLPLSAEVDAVRALLRPPR